MRFGAKRYKYAVIGLIVALVLSAGGYAATTLLTLNSGNQKVTRIKSAFPVESSRPTPLEDEDSNGQNLLLLGVDSYGNVGKSQDEITGTRADSIMLAHVSADGRHLTLISIVRDTWVEIPGYGHDRINAAMSRGGTATMVATVEQLLQTRIDHVAIIDFSGFKRVIDELGGVTVDNPEYFTYSIYPYYEFPEGTLTLCGKEALAFSRERKHVDRGDFQRAENQREVVLSLFGKVRSQGVITDPLRGARLFEAISPYLALDEGLDAGYAIRLANHLRNLDSKYPITAFTLMISGGGINEYGMSVVYLDELKLAKVQERLAGDSIHQFKKPLGWVDPSATPMPSDSASPSESSVSATPAPSDIECPTE